MARRKPAWLQQREADLAKARENYYATRSHTTTTTVVPRKMTSGIYTSLNILKGGTHAVFRVPVSKKSFAFFGEYAGLGLQNPADYTDPVSNEPRGNFVPSKVIATVGIAAPTARINGWGSRVIRYTATAEGDAQSSYSAPFGTGATAPTPDALDTKATAIYTAAKTKMGNLDYARFYWYPEEASFSKGG